MFTYIIVGLIFHLTVILFFWPQTLGFSIEGFGVLFLGHTRRHVSSPVTVLFKRLGSSILTESSEQICFLLV
jgi:hypothetical protein